MSTRDELVAALRERYGGASRVEKGRILDEFAAVAGYHRKHAIRLLTTPPRQRGGPRPHRRRYGESVRAALTVAWEAADRICSKRLKPMLPVLVPVLERHGRLQLDDALREQLLAVSPATMDRLLDEARLAASGGRRRRAGFSSAVRRSVPIRTFGDWQDPPPGFVEVDLVAHCGTSVRGAFVQTLVLTDVATGWTECLPLLLRDGSLVIEALERAAELFPFPLLGMDFDNDSTFMNEPVVEWCRRRGFEVTRSRAYRKNDQAWVEQKNGAIVRRLVGYGRFEGRASVDTMARLYAAARLHGNLFLPSFKLRSKTRIGARVVKRYHPPEPPLARTLAHPAVTATAKAALRRLRRDADPVLLLAAIRAAQAELGGRVDARGLRAREATPSPALEALIANLGSAWRDGERRPTHRRPYRRVKPIPKRPGVLDGVQAEIAAWLEADADLTTVVVRQRLEERYPSRFAKVSERTFQRAVRSLRASRAKRIVAATAALLGATTPVDLLDDAGASPTTPPAPPPQRPTSDSEIAGSIGR